MNKTILVVALVLAMAFMAFAQTTSAPSKSVGAVNRTLPTGWSLVALPMVPASTNIQAVFADNNGAGNQLTGGSSVGTSDQVWNESGAFAWYYSGTPGTGWYGSLSQVVPDEGYWILNRTAPKTIKLLGEVSTVARQQTVNGGNTWNLVGITFPKNYALTDPSNGLIASGFSGGLTSGTSSQIWNDAGQFAWLYDDGPGGAPTTWAGSLTTLEYGKAYYILNRGSTFIWTVNPPTNY